MPIWNRISQEKINAIYADWKGGMSYKQLVARHKVSMSAISRHLKNMRHKRAIPVTTTAIVVHGSNGSQRKGSQYNHLFPEIQKLRAAGLTGPQIAEKLNMPKTAVSYYLYTKMKSKEIVQQGEPTNGTQRLHPQFLVGFGCAEIERAVSAVSQRLGVTPTLLRSGYSKFLDYTPVR